MKKIIMGLVTGLVTLGLHCTQDRSLPSGYDVLERDDKGAVHVLTLHAAQSGSFWRVPTTGLESSLLLGNDEYLTAHFIVKFYNLTAIDTATVFSAKLFLTNSYQYGDVGTASAPIYALTSDWNENSVTWKEISENIDYSIPAGMLEYSGQDLDSLALTTVGVDLDPDLINRWIADETVNQGLFIDGSDFPIMAEFVSVDNSDYWPYLQLIHVDKSGETDTTIVNNYLKDASLLIRKDKVAENFLFENTLTVSSAAGDQSLLLFDISPLPLECTIHQAILELKIKSEEKYIRDSGFLVSAAAVVSDSLWDPLTVKADSVSAVASTVVEPEDDVASFSNSTAIRNMTRIVQMWIVDRETNRGLFLKAMDSGRTPCFVTFFADSTQADMLPILKLTYSVPPSPRFFAP
ncbi:DNRLRE domain-containing protein [candidate division KSB1 bacterium]|nr:DNRLRE domain-containing protein [candidate division KSB1 bacterium]